MEKTIIAVRGAADAGKTTAIRCACAQMLSDGASVESILVSPSFEGIDGYLIRDLTSQSKEGDIAIILSYCNHKIGICSQGDCGCEKQIRAYLEAFKEVSCDLIICATRTRGRTCETVKAFSADNGYKLEWFSKLSNRYISLEALHAKTMEFLNGENRN